MAGSASFFVVGLIIGFLVSLAFLVVFVLPTLPRPIAPPIPAGFTAVVVPPILNSTNTPSNTPRNTPSEELRPQCEYEIITDLAGLRVRAQEHWSIKSFSANPGPGFIALLEKCP